MSRGCLWDLTNYFEICLLKVITKFMAKLAIQLEENKILLIFCYTNIRLKYIKNSFIKHNSIYSLTKICRLKFRAGGDLHQIGNPEVKIRLTNLALKTLKILWSKKKF